MGNGRPLEESGRPIRLGARGLLLRAAARPRRGRLLGPRRGRLLAAGLGALPRLRLRLLLGLRLLVLLRDGLLLLGLLLFFLLGDGLLLLVLGDGLLLGVLLVLLGVRLGLLDVLVLDLGVVVLLVLRGLLLGDGLAAAVRALLVLLLLALLVGLGDDLALLDLAAPGAGLLIAQLDERAEALQVAARRALHEAQAGGHLLVQPVRREVEQEHHAGQVLVDLVERDDALVPRAALGLPGDALVRDLVDDLEVPLALDEPDLGAHLQVRVVLLRDRLDPLHPARRFLELRPLVVRDLEGHGHVDVVLDREPARLHVVPLARIAAALLLVIVVVATARLDLVDHALERALGGGHRRPRAAGPFKLGLPELHRGLGRGAGAAVLLELLLGELGSLRGQHLGGLLGARGGLLLEDFLGGVPRGVDDGLEKAGTPGAHAVLECVGRCGHGSSCGVLGVFALLSRLFEAVLGGVLRLLRLLVGRGLLGLVLGLARHALSSRMPAGVGRGMHWWSRDRGPRVFLPSESGTRGQ